MLIISSFSFSSFSSSFSASSSFILFHHLFYFHLLLPRNCSKPWNSTTFYELVKMLYLLLRYANHRLESYYINNKRALYSEYAMFLDIFTQLNEMKMILYFTYCKIAQSCKTCNTTTNSLNTNHQHTYFLTEEECCCKNTQGPKSSHFYR